MLGLSPRDGRRRCSGIGHEGGRKVPALKRAGCALVARAGGRSRRMDQAKMRLAMSAMVDHATAVQALACRLGMSRFLPYMHVTRNGTPMEANRRVLKDAA